MSSDQEPPVVRVVIADDHPLLRMGVRAALNPESSVKVVGEARSFRDLMSLLLTVEADVVLLDLGGMGTPAVTAVTSLARTYPRTAIIILSSTLSSARELLKLGASGYVAKEDVEGEAITAINAVMRGRQFLSPAVVDYLERSGRGRKLSGLTPREWDVFRLNAEGHSTEAMADQLKISYNALCNYISNLYSKTGCTTRTQLAECYHQMVDSRA